MATIATRVEFAFGADLNNPGSWVWTDVSRFAVGTQVKITPGRPDEAATTTPTRCVFRLRNSPLPGGPAADNGRFTPRFPASPHYPFVRRQTPVRVSLNPGGLGWFQRFQGYVDAFVPQWLSSNTDYAEVEVTASGSLRRLMQGQSPLRSAMFRAYIQSNPAAYWSLEGSVDPLNPANSPSGLGLTAPMTLSGTGLVRFGGADGPPGSASVADFSSSWADGTILSGPVPDNPAATSWRVEFSMRYKTTDSSYQVVMSGWNTGGGASQWYMDANPAGTGLRMFYIAGGLPVQVISAPSYNGNDGLWHHYRAEGSKLVGDTPIFVYVDGVLIASATAVGVAFGSINKMNAQAGLVNLTAGSENNPQDSALGHVAVWQPYVSGPDTFRAFQGWAGETAGDRIVRLCAEGP